MAAAREDWAEAPFWRRKSLGEMTPEEWESLCDGCGKCCLHKLEYVDTGEIAVTSVACRLLDLATCRCGDYANRKRRVPDCLMLTPESVAELPWMPTTCAYRLIAEGRDLYWWHPLVSGERRTVHDAGISVRDRVISEREAGDPEDYVVDWEL